MPILKNKDGTYCGTFDVHDCRTPDAFIEHSSRDYVAWRLRKEFADRLERAARDMAVLAHVLDGFDWTVLENPVIESQVPKLLHAVTSALSMLRDAEPSLMLCADIPEEGGKLTLDDGTVLDEVEYGEWSASSDALERRVRRAQVDGAFAFAASDAIDALIESGHGGPKTAEIADYLSDTLRWDVGKLVSEKLTPDEIRRVAAAHIRVVKKLAGCWAWKKMENDRSEYSSLLWVYRDEIKYELMSPAERVEEDRRRAEADRYIAKVHTERDAKTTRKPKRTIAAKRSARPAKTRRAA